MDLPGDDFMGELSPPSSLEDRGEQDPPNVRRPQMTWKPPAEEVFDAIERVEDIPEHLWIRMALQASDDILRCWKTSYGCFGDILTHLLSCFFDMDNLVLDTSVPLPSMRMLSLIQRLNGRPVYRLGVASGLHPSIQDPQLIANFQDSGNDVWSSVVQSLNSAACKLPAIKVALPRDAVEALLSLQNLWDPVHARLQHACFLWQQGVGEDDDLATCITRAVNLQEYASDNWIHLRITIAAAILAAVDRRYHIFKDRALKSYEQVRDLLAHAQQLPEYTKDQFLTPPSNRDLICAERGDPVIVSKSDVAAKCQMALSISCDELTAFSSSMANVAASLQWVAFWERFFGHHPGGYTWCGQSELADWTRLLYPILCATAKVDDPYSSVNYAEGGFLNLVEEEGSGDAEQVSALGVAWFRKIFYNVTPSFWALRPVHQSLLELAKKESSEHILRAGRRCMLWAHNLRLMGVDLLSKKMHEKANTIAALAFQGLAAGSDIITSFSEACVYNNVTVEQARDFVMCGCAANQRTELARKIEHAPDKDSVLARWMTVALNESVKVIEGMSELERCDNVICLMDEQIKSIPDERLSEFVALCCNAIKRGGESGVSDELDFAIQLLKVQAPFGVPPAFVLRQRDDWIVVREQLLRYMLAHTLPSNLEVFELQGVMEGPLDEAAVETFLEDQKRRTFEYILYTYGVDQAMAEGVEDASLVVQEELVDAVFSIFERDCQGQVSASLKGLLDFWSNGLTTLKLDAKGASKVVVDLIRHMKKQKTDQQKLEVLIRNKVYVGLEGARFMGGRSLLDRMLVLLLGPHAHDLEIGHARTIAEEEGYASLPESLSNVRPQVYKVQVMG